jgi:hypothetical protein
MITACALALGTAAGGLLLAVPAVHASPSAITGGSSGGPCAVVVAAGPSADTPGAYIPQCARNGNFKPLQHHPATGYRWCVGPATGTEVPGTRTPPGAASPVCG